MYKCKKCGSEFEGKFCPECGEKREEQRLCRNCGEKLADGVKFCPECGSLQIESNVSEAAPAPLAPVNSDEDIYAFNRAEKGSVQVKDDKKLQFMLGFLGKSGKLIVWLYFLTVTAIVSLSLFVSYYMRSFVNPSQVVPVIAAVLGVAGIVIFVCTAVKFLSKEVAPNYSELLQIRRKLIKYLSSTVVLFLMCLVAAIVLYLASVTAAGGFLIFLTVFLFAVMIAVCIIGLVFFKKIENRYIVKNPDDTVVNYLTPYVMSSVQELQSANEQYVQVRNGKRAAAGKLPKTPHEYDREKLFIKILYSVAAILLCSLVFLLVAFVPRNIFTLSRIERISVGDSIEYVQRILGEPFDKSEYGADASGTYSYCSDGLAKTIAAKNAQLEKLENAESFDDLEKLFELGAQIAELEAELAAKRCDYIYVSYERGKVSNIDFVKDVSYGEDISREIKDITYCYQPSDMSYFDYGAVITVEKDGKNITDGNYVICTVYVREYFTDGGMRNKSVEISVDVLERGAQTVEWSDAYGGHEISVIVK